MGRRLVRQPCPYNSGMLFFILGKQLRKGTVGHSSWEQPRHGPLARLLLHWADAHAAEH